MANYVGIKQILNQFWAKEKAANDAKYLTSADIANFVDSNTVDSKISTAVAGMSKLHFSVVESLPEGDSIDTTCIYLVAETTGNISKDAYGEWIYINSKWEKLGTTSTVSVEGYLTEADAANTYETITNVASHTGNTTIHITAEERTAWNSKQNALSTEQLAAVNSGITSELVSKIGDINVTDVKVKDAEGNTNSVVVDKIATIDLSNVQTKLTEDQMSKIANAVTQTDIDAAVTLSDNDFNDIFAEK